MIFLSFDFALFPSRISYLFVKFPYYRNTESQQQRFLMRQEKTLKIIVNTLIDPRVKMTQMASNDKTWVWSCYDFSDGEIVEEVFAFKCTSIEDAKAFKEVASQPYAFHARLGQILFAGLFPCSLTCLFGCPLVRPSTRPRARWRNFSRVRTGRPTPRPTPPLKPLDPFPPRLKAFVCGKRIHHRKRKSRPNSLGYPSYLGKLLREVRFIPPFFDRLRI